MDAATVDYAPLTVSEVEEGLRCIEPSDYWLKHGSVENILGWRTGDILRFVRSIETQERGRTRGKTTLSEAQVKLESVGMFLKESHLAVSGVNGGPCPFWGASNVTEIREPRGRDERENHRHGQSNAQQPTRDDRPHHPGCARGEVSADGTIEGQGGSPQKSSGVVDVEEDDVEAEVQDDVLSCDGSEVMDPIDVGEVGQGGDGVSGAPPDVDAPLPVADEWRYDFGLNS